MKNLIESYYDAEYFAWQKSLGVFGGKMNADKFKKYVNNQDTVLDFGCGGGYILSNLLCKRKIGVEINDSARLDAEANKIEVFKAIIDVPDDTCDLIISHHALEHTENPFEVIKQLLPKLKVDGKVVFIIPNEKKKKWNPNDINKHLYTWAEINIGNLFDFAGYDVLSVKEIYHRWPPKYMLINKYFGKNIFNLSCIVYGYLRRNLSQIEIVA